MRSILFSFLVLLFFSCKSKQPIVILKGPNTLSGAEKALGWQLLFDGKTMNQWRVYKGDNTQGWRIENGEMTALGQKGLSADIITRDTFSNFELSLEWNISNAGNSGIFFNVNEVAHLKAVHESGPEYQMIDEKGYDYPLEGWQITGANYAMHSPKIDVVKPQGEYNKSRIIVDNGKVQHWLNDRLIVQYELWSQEWEKLKQSGKWKDYPEYGIYKSGHVALQDHGSQSRFRNIKIRRL